MAFQTIRPKFVYDLARHEAGHAAVALHLHGRGSVILATLYEVTYRAPSPISNKDHLTFFASGIRAAQHFGANWHGGELRADGSDDITKATKIWSKMPGQAAEWAAALDRAAEIVAQRADFIDEVGDRLEIEKELAGDEVDKIWSSFSPQPALH